MGVGRVDGEGIETLRRTEKCCRDGEKRAKLGTTAAALGFMGGGREMFLAASPMCLEQASCYEV